MPRWIEDIPEGRCGRCEFWTYDSAVNWDDWGHARNRDDGYCRRMPPSESHSWPKTNPWTGRCAEFKADSLGDYCVALLQYDITDSERRAKRDNDARDKYRADQFERDREYRSWKAWRARMQLRVKRIFGIGAHQ